MCENFIKQFRANDDVSTNLFGRARNFAAKADDDQLEVVQHYKKAIEIYCKLNKKEESIRLVKSLLTLVDTSYNGTINFAILLLLALKDVIDSLENFREGTKKEVRERLQNLIIRKLEEQHLDFWLLRSAIYGARKMAGGNRDIEDDIDQLRCEILPLEAHNSLIVENLGHAAACYSEVAQVAQQLGNKEQSQKFLQQASEINLRIHAQPFHSDPVTEGLNQIASQIIHNITAEQFLPSPEEMKNEYDSIENKLGHLLQDKHLLIKDDVLSEEAEKYGNNFLFSIPAQYLDQYGNPRNDRQLISLLEETYLRQVINIIGYLFWSWQDDDLLKETDITDFLLTSSLSEKYDWRIFRQGLSRHFERDYIGSVHILMPQFENILRRWAEEADISVKKLNANAKGTNWGQKLLGDLLSNADIKRNLGDDLVRVIKLYLDTNEPFGFRHKVAHGFIPADSCDVVLSSMIIWLTLMVIKTPLPSDSPSA